MSVRLLAAGIALLSGLMLPARSGLAETKHQAVSLALLYPIGTNQDPNVSTTLELSALYGRVGSIRALGINGAVCLLGSDLHGIDITGVYSQVNGDARGFMLTGVASYTVGDTRGAQAAGLVNVTRGGTRGAGLAGLFNMTGKDLVGVQATSLLNMVGQGGQGFQLSGFANVIGGSFNGWQVSGGFNFVGDRQVGLQFGGVNVAPRMEGTQIGVANFAQNATGLQVGAFNSAKEQRGIPFGMVNLAQNGSVDWVTYGSNISGVNTGVRTSIRRCYSILTAGIPDAQGDVSQTLILTWNYGYAIPAGRKTSIGLDLGFAHYIPEKVSDPNENDRLHFALQARALAERTVSRRARVFAGAGVARISSEYRLDAASETKPLFFGGIGLY